MMPPVKLRGGIITAQHSTKSGIGPNAGAGVGEITCDSLMPDRFQGGAMFGLRQPAISTQGLAINPAGIGSGKEGHDASDIVGLP